jgi:hypothetical protein
LHDAAGDAVDGVDGADLVRAEAEAAGEFEGEVHVGIVRVYPWVVEKDGEDLVVGDGVQGQEGVREEIDAGLAGEDLGVAGAFSFDGDLVGAGHGRFGQQGCRCLVVNEGQPPPFRVCFAALESTG